MEFPDLRWAHVQGETGKRLGCRLGEAASVDLLPLPPSPIFPDSIEKKSPRSELTEGQLAGLEASVGGEGYPARSEHGVGAVVLADWSGILLAQATV
jgi:hypothetical protein